MPTQEFFSSLRGGINYANMIFADGYNYSNIKPKIGFNAGAVGRFVSINSPFEVEIGILYSRKGAKIERAQVSLEGYSGNFELNRNYQLNYFDFPLLVNISTRGKSDIQLYAGGGILVSMGSKGKVDDIFKSQSYEVEFSNEVVWDDSPEAHFKKVDLSYIGQVGLRIKVYEINVSISQSLFNIVPNNDFVKNSIISLSFAKEINRRYVR